MSENVTAGVESVYDQLRGLLGQPVRVTLLDPSTGARRARVPGILGRVSAEALTIEASRYVPLHPEGTPATIELLAGGSQYWGYCQLVSIDAAGRICLQLPAQLQSAQRRRHPRVDVDMPVNFLLRRTGMLLSGQLRDLSAGGASLVASEPLNVTDQVTLLFGLGSGLFLRPTEANVLRCGLAQEGQYVAALQFLCEAEQEEAIAHWVAEQLAR